jgi:hypothetical protein
MTWLTPLAAVTVSRRAIRGTYRIAPGLQLKSELPIPTFFPFFMP